MKGYMLDTNVFNRLFKKEISVSDFDGKALFATHVQSDELQRTKDQTLATELLAVFKSVSENHIPTTSAVWGDSRWGESRWNDGNLYNRLHSRLQELDKNSKKHPRDPLNQSRDARLAETAIENQLTLVSGDRNLVALINEFGGSGISPEDLRSP